MKIRKNAYIYNSKPIFIEEGVPSLNLNKNLNINGFMYLV